jgi:hypothetical protein
LQNGNILKGRLDFCGLFAGANTPELLSPKRVAGFKRVEYMSRVTREIPGLRMSWALNLFGIHCIVSGSLNGQDTSVDCSWDSRNWCSPSEVLELSRRLR